MSTNRISLFGSRDPLACWNYNAVSRTHGLLFQSKRLDRLNKNKEYIRERRRDRLTYVNRRGRENAHASRRARLTGFDASRLARERERERRGATHELDGERERERRRATLRTNFNESSLVPRRTRNRRLLERKKERKEERRRSLVPRPTRKTPNSPTRTTHYARTRINKKQAVDDIAITV